MSQDLFARLLSHAERDDVVVAHHDKARWVKRVSLDDAELMAKADMESLVLSRQMRAVLLSHETRLYFIVSGFSDCVDLPPGLSRTAVTPGVFVASIIGLDVAPSSSGHSIRDAIEDMYDGVAGYEGHSLDALLPLFPTLNCFTVDPKFEVSRSLNRIVGSYLSRSYEDGPLDFSPSLRAELSGFFEAGSKHIPFAIALQGLLSFTWSGFFVDLYRCIEQLYAVPRLVELTKEMEIQAFSPRLSRVN